MINLDLHSYKDQLVVKKVDGNICVLGIIRKKYLVLQPEEMVRQLLIHYLIAAGYPKEKIQVEKGINVHGLYRRFDIIVYDQHYEPFLLIECKAHTVPIDQKAFDQMATYNIAVKAPYLIACNGVQTYCCKLNYLEKKFTRMKTIPAYER